MDLKSNKKLGNNFEKEVAEILSKKGCWVTMLTPKQHTGSQPADLIAIMSDIAILVDCKTCSTHLFPISRIEQNQWLAYEKYRKWGNMNYYIAIKYKEDIYMIPMNTIDKTAKSIDLRTQMKWEWESENYSKQ